MARNAGCTPCLLCRVAGEFYCLHGGRGEVAGIGGEVPIPGSSGIDLMEVWAYLVQKGVLVGYG